MNREKREILHRVVGLDSISHKENTDGGITIHVPPETTDALVESIKTVPGLSEKLHDKKIYRNRAARLLHDAYAMDLDLSEYKLYSVGCDAAFTYKKR